jgi:hypothetical protein
LEYKREKEQFTGGRGIFDRKEKIRIKKKIHLELGNQGNTDLEELRKYPKELYFF